MSVQKPTLDGFHLFLWNYKNIIFIFTIFVRRFFLPRRWLKSGRREWWIDDLGFDLCVLVRFFQVSVLLSEGVRSCGACFIHPIPVSSPTSHTWREQHWRCWDSSWSQCWSTAALTHPPQIGIERTQIIVHLIQFEAKEPQSDQKE